MDAVPVEGGRRVRAHGLRVAGRRSVVWAAAATVAVLVVWRWLILIKDTPGDLAFDFRQFWQGARDVVNGVSPYPSAELLATAGSHLGPQGIQEVFRFPYPAGAAVALAPFGLLGFHAAAAIWSAVLVASLLGALWILGVRDWRAFAVALSSVPVMSAVHLGTLTPLLILLVAVAWRWRDRGWIAGAAVAAAICLKLFLWPLVVWLAATRRFAAAAFATGLALVLTVGAWAAIGFEGLSEYPELLQRLTEVVADRGFSLVALGVQAGLPSAVAELLPWLAGLALLAWTVATARGNGLDRASFSIAVAASIALTPIVWLHSFALLIVPLALAHPRLSPAWLLLWAFWVMPGQENDGHLWRILVAIPVATAALVTCARRPDRPMTVR